MFRIAKPSQLFIAVLSLCLIATVAFSAPQPKYVFAVRENITHSGNSVSWELWCQHEYASGKIKKNYLGTYNMVNSTNLADRVETNRCPKVGVL